MKRHKICKNPNCQRCFVPSKNNPNQDYCSREECKRYRNAQRQQRYYERVCADPSKYRQMLKRKKAERRRRMQRRQELSKAASPSSRRSICSHNQEPAPDSRLWHFAAGFLYYTAGVKEKADVEEGVSRCINKGAELLQQGPIQ